MVLFVFQLSQAQLSIYSNYNLQGTSGSCLVRTIYTGNSIPNGLNDGIKSISLNQGYMATLAENIDGTGERFTYMANKSNINVNLAFLLQNKVSFIRVLKLPNTLVKKRGSAATDNNQTANLNASWFYDWGSSDNSIPAREYVPMAWNGSGTADAAINAVIARDSLTHYSAFNEPDNKGQANMFVVNAVPLYQKLLRAGQRMGSPVCTENGYSTWLDSFTNVANQQNLQIDYVCVHWYDWGNWTSTSNANPNATDVFNRFTSYIASVYNRYQKPIWVTEFNANPNRPSSVQLAFMQLAIPWLDSDPRIERYSYFFGTDVPVYSSGITLSACGSYYANQASVNAYANNIIDTRPAFPVTLAAWDPSTFSHGGYNVINFTPTTLDANITALLGLTRGAGVTLPDSTVSNGYWGGTGWSTSGTDAQSGISANKILKFSLQSKTGKSVNYQSIDKFNIRVNSSGPVQYQIDYQINNGTFYPCATLSVPTRITANYALGPVDLSGIAGLQNVPSTSTVTFRITPFDASSTGTFLIGSGINDTIADLTLLGGYTEDNIITTTLPVILTNFQLKRTNNAMLLNWETQTEVNFNYFEIERSEDANTFYTIATINGLNQLNGSKYNYTDAPISNTTKYYRLKMIDKDGSFLYSNILSDNYITTNMSFVVYPTITTGNTIKTTFNNVSKNAQIKILNVNGQLLSTYSLQDGANTQNIAIGNLLKGIYFIILQDKGTIQSRKFIKQ